MSKVSVPCLVRVHVNSANMERRTENLREEKTEQDMQCDVWVKLLYSTLSCAKYTLKVIKNWWGGLH